MCSPLSGVNCGKFWYCDILSLPLGRNDFSNSELYNFEDSQKVFTEVFHMSVIITFNNELRMTQQAYCTILIKINVAFIKFRAPKMVEIQIEKYLVSSTTIHTTVYNSVVVGQYISSVSVECSSRTVHISCIRGV